MAVKKNDISNIKQEDVSTAAARALREMRSSVLRMPIRLHGTSPMLMNRWTNKAITIMLANMTGHDLPRMPKDLTNDFDASWYRNEEGLLCLPCRIIKAAIVNGATPTGKLVSKAELKRDLRVLGFTTPLTLPEGTDMSIDIKVVKTAGMAKTPDIRARALIPAGWTCDVVLQFPRTLSVDKSVAALDAAGASMGLCDFRLEKGGDYGAFDIEFLESTDAVVDDIIERCKTHEEPLDIPEYLLRAYNAASAEDKKKLDKKKVPMRRTGANGAAAEA